MPDHTDLPDAVSSLVQLTKLTVLSYIFSSDSHLCTVRHRCTTASGRSRKALATSPTWRAVMYCFHLFRVVLGSFASPCLVCDVSKGLA